MQRLDRCQVWVLEFSYVQVETSGSRLSIHHFFLVQTMSCAALAVSFCIHCSIRFDSNERGEDQGICLIYCSGTGTIVLYVDTADE